MRCHLQHTTGPNDLTFTYTVIVSVRDTNTGSSEVLAAFCQRAACLALGSGAFAAVQVSWFGYTPIQLDGASMLMMVLVIGKSQALPPTLGQDKKPLLPGGLKNEKV